MRTAYVGMALMMLAIGTAAQAPPPLASLPKVPAMQGDLAQVMRGVLFTNSNILFDVQTNDPGEPKKVETSGGGASQSYANVYAGWPAVEGAAAALQESVDMILKARLCSNGKPAPILQDDYKKFAEELRGASRKALQAAIDKNQEKVSDSTNDLADACSNCHEVYRDKGPVGSAARCTP